MVKRSRFRGLSILSVLVLVSIVVVVAAAMTGVFTMNMNVTQRVSNGTIALAEAEAGLTEVLYQITRDGHLDPEPAARKEGEDSIVTWGLNGETIRGTITPEMGSDKAFHVVTFARDSEFPYSTNNTNLTNNTGYLGRTIPDGAIHVVSTGYCNGQYRTVECIVEKPPFPFGLATTGPIVSVDPIVVKGTSSAGVFDPNEEGDRPGHLLTNSKEGVSIGASSGRQTEISGFVKSSGGVSIAQPAVVRGGVRTYTDESTLTDIDISNFDLIKEPSGVVNIVDSLYVKDQKLDVMYRYSGPHLVYKGSVSLEKAMLYVDGDLTIEGPLKGEGLVVVNGNAHFKSGTSLLGSNKMAVLASGDITIEGANNYFMGLVYCEGNLKASNISIVGTTVVNAPDSSKGRAELQNVSVISNEETRDMTVEVTTSSEAGTSLSVGDGFLPSFPYFDTENGEAPTGVFGFDPTKLKSDGSYDNVTGLLDRDAYEKKMEKLANDTAIMLFDVARDGGQLPDWNEPPFINNSESIWENARNIYKEAQKIAQAKADMDNAQQAIPSDPSDPGHGGAVTAYEDQKKKFEELSSLEAREDFIKALDGLGSEIVDYQARHARADGSFKDGLAKEDIKRSIRFNLNEYLPESERVKVSFWRVYPRRL